MSLIKTNFLTYTLPFAAVSMTDLYQMIAMPLNMYKTDTEDMKNCHAAQYGNDVEKYAGISD